MPTLFELLSSEVGPQTTQARRPRWAREREKEKRSPFGSTPVERETDAVVPPGATMSAGTDSGGSDSSDATQALSQGIFDAELFDLDPIGAISSAEKSGFFGTLQSLGAAAMMFSGDKDQSRLGFGLMQGQAREKQFQQREKRLGAEAAVRNQRQREQDLFTRQIKSTEEMRQQFETASKAIKEMPTDPGMRRQYVLSAQQNLAPGAAAMVALAADPQNTAQAYQDTIVGGVMSVGDKLLAQATHAVKDPKRVQAAVQNAFPHAEALVESMRQNNILNPEQSRYLAENPAAMKRLGDAWGLPSSEAAWKAKMAGATAGATESAKISAKVQAMGLDPNSPEGQKAAQKLLMKPSTTIDMGGREIDKSDAKWANDILDAGEKATGRAPFLAQLEKSFASDTFQTGALGPIRADLSKLLNLAGVPGEKIHPVIGSAKTADAMIAATANLTNSLTKDTDNARLKMAFETLTQAVPNIGVVPEAGKAITATLQSIDQWKQDRADFLLAQRDDDKSLLEIRKAVRAWDKENAPDLSAVEEMLESAKKSAGSRWRTYDEAQKAIVGKDQVPGEGELGEEVTPDQLPVEFLKRLPPGAKVYRLQK